MIDGPRNAIGVAALGGQVHDRRTLAAGRNRVRFGVWGAVLFIVAALALVWDSGPSEDSLPDEDLTRNLPGSQRQAAILLLHGIHAAQVRFRAAKCIDSDGDGKGEFGYFTELAGQPSARATAAKLALLDAPVLSGRFRDIKSHPAYRGGVVIHRGYVFQLFLPDANGDGVPEPARGKRPADAATIAGPDPNRSERTWCCYAWPLRRNSLGRDTLFVNQTGDVLGTEAGAQGYEGTTRVPACDAAFLQGSRRRMASTIACDDVGQDGQTWVTVH